MQTLRIRRTGRYCTPNISRVVKIFDRMRTSFEKKKKKIKGHSRARVYIPRNGVKLRKATLTWIKLLLAVSASRVAYGFGNCIDARCAFRKSILSLKQLGAQFYGEKNANAKVAPFNSLNLSVPVALVPLVKNPASYPDEKGAVRNAR